jgi:acetyltransferase-like isoleucine patch superfamily enzyme
VIKLTLILINKTILILSYLISYLISPKVIALLLNFYASVIWCGYRRKFLSVGKESFIRFPASIHNPKFIELGNNFKAEKGLILEAFDRYGEDGFSPKVIVGDNCSFGYHCHIGCINKIEIGNNLLAASNIFMSDHSHGENSLKEAFIAPIKRRLSSKGPIKIGNNVWIGECVMILSGVTIGDRCVIGANSVVTCDIPSNSIAAGNPAKVLRELT